MGQVGGTYVTAPQLADFARLDPFWIPRFSLKGSIGWPQTACVCPYYLVPPPLFLFQ
jgi:hypothetical protein